MKRTIYHLSAALALLTALAACTQDIPSSPAGGAEGTPIVFTATGLNPTTQATAGTRAPVDGDWKEVQTVAVEIGGDVKEYTVTATGADSKSATLASADDPFYWNGSENTVTAWWPYTSDQETLPDVQVRADQSDRADFVASDLIAAIQSVTGNQVNLVFHHRTALVRIELTDYTEGLASVQLTNLSTEGGNPATLTPHDEGGYTYAALVAPQTVAAGTAFITCVFSNGRSFIYRMQKDAQWEAGETYTYTVSLAAADPDYSYSGNTYTPNNAKGLQKIAQLVNNGKTDIDITLTSDIDLTGIGWTPIGTEEHPYTGTFDGGNKTISNLTIDQPEGDCLGLFGVVGTGGKVQKIVLDGVRISGRSNVGGIAGQNNGGTLSKCQVRNGAVSGTGENVGGVVGQLGGGAAEGCWSSASVKGGTAVGGVAGQNDGSLTACYSWGDVTGTGANVGGVAGQNEGGTLTACYHATGAVTGADESTGGVAGENNGTLTACYWANNQEQGIGVNEGGSTTGGTEQVTDGNWTNARNEMNNALKSANSEWQYNILNDEGLPELESF